MNGFSNFSWLNLDPNELNVKNAIVIACVRKIDKYAVAFDSLPDGYAKYQTEKP